MEVTLEKRALASLRRRIDSALSAEEELCRRLLHVGEAPQEGRPLDAAGALETELNVGSVSEVTQNMDQIIQGYMRALEDFPDHGGLCYDLGRLLAKKGWLIEAEAAFRRALRDNPHDPQVNRTLGDVLSDQGKIVEAQEYYRRAGA
ncbi:MAG: tetratricopeptide repeat protein [Magnetococcus sp. WYHC-3]